MKEQVYKLGFPRVKKLVAFISLIAVLGFMTTLSQGFTHSDGKAVQERTSQELPDNLESYFAMVIR